MIHTSIVPFSIHQETQLKFQQVQLSRITVVDIGYGQLVVQSGHMINNYLLAISNLSFGIPIFYWNCKFHALDSQLGGCFSYEKVLPPSHERENNGHDFLGVHAHLGGLMAPMLLICWRLPVINCLSMSWTDWYDPRLHKIWPRSIAWGTAVWVVCIKLW